MSADSWAVCPRCVRRAEASRQQDLDAVQATYGKVPSAEFIAALAAVPEMPAPQQTFRENYEIYGAATGTVRVGYKGSCTRCGLELIFSHEHKIEGITS